MPYENSVSIIIEIPFSRFEKSQDMSLGLLAATRQCLKIE